MGIEVREFGKGGEIAKFEVGHLAPDNCDYVFIPEDGRLERIYGEEIGSIEGQEVQRVETQPDRWYEVDGHTRFARKL